MTPRLLVSLSRAHNAANSDDGDVAGHAPLPRSRAQRGTTTDLLLLSQMPVR
jgi:hypothetical protein